MLLKIIDRFLKLRKKIPTSPREEREVDNDFARENMKRNFLNDTIPSKDDSFITQKEQSMIDSQGVSDFSGSGYNGPGNVDREKTNSNMSQRNFER
jgi:hypothetical protein